MAYGPVELLVVGFPGNQFSGEIIPALEELIENGIIRIIDLMFAMKDADGVVIGAEISDLGEEVSAAFTMIVDDPGSLLGDDDVAKLGAGLPLNSSAAIMLFENTWATKFRDAVLNANGQLILNERIPRAVIEELVAAQGSAEA